MGDARLTWEGEEGTGSGRRDSEGRGEMGGRDGEGKEGERGGGKEEGEGGGGRERGREWVCVKMIG